MPRATRSFILALGVLVLASGLGIAQNTLDDQGIHVSGVGIVYGAPDLALLDLGVNKADEDLSLAIAGANDAMHDIMQALALAGVDENDIRTTDFNIWREERRGPDQQAQAPLYHVDNVVQVTVRQVSRAGELLNAAIEAGANEVRGIRYTFANPEELQRRARRLAMQDAKDTAQQLAALADVELGTVQEIRENTGSAPQPYFAERAMAMSAADAIPVSGGQLAVTVMLDVTFGIVPVLPAATGGAGQ